MTIYGYRKKSAQSGYLLIKFLVVLAIIDILAVLATAPMVLNRFLLH
jgi:type II secretory pathway pseudopilin PulG